MANDYTIKNFYQNIAQNTPLLLGYQFLVTLSPGAGVANYNLDKIDFKKLQLLCQSAQIPQKTINTADVNYFGKRFSVPTAETPQHSWTTNIILTNRMDSYHELRKLMLRFSSLENNMGGIRTIPNLDIIVDVLNQFSEIDQTQPRIVMKGCFPRQLQEIQLQYQEQANVITPSVTFVYQYSYFTNPGVDRNALDSLNPSNVAPLETDI